MSHPLAFWQSVRERFARRLSWKLTLSHLAVALICQAINLVGVVFLLTFAGRSGPTFNSQEMVETTRLLAITLAGPMGELSSEELSKTLAQLPQDSGNPLATNILSQSSVLVVVGPEGAVLASSTPNVPTGTLVTVLEPSVWGQVIEAAQSGESDVASSSLSGGDASLRVMVSAYPIIDSEGRVLGALGLRRAQTVPDAPMNPLWMVASLSVLFGGLFVAVGVMSSVIASVAGVALARGFGQRLGRLEAATEAIARGDLSARVPVTSPDEIGQLGERFNLLTARLDEVDRARRAFVSNISHELRTPLAIIRGHVEAELARGDGAAPTRETLETIDQSARALSGLIDDLFTLTRIEEATLPFQPRTVAVQEIAAAVVTGIRPLASAQGYIEVHSVVPADLPPVLADPTRLTQILNNLLYNALRHTPDGGVIVIEGGLSADGDAVEIAVTDTGIGIAPEKLPYIFDRFFQGENGSGAQGNQSGSGLGLAIVKQLVEAQGGTVRAESEMGKGTSIRFTLPRS